MFVQLTEAEWRIYASPTKAMIGSNNGLSPVRRQAIIWTNAILFSIRPLGTNFSQIVSEIQIFSFKKWHFENVVRKLSAILSRSQYVNHNNTECIYRGVYSTSIA